MPSRSASPSDHSRTSFVVRVRGAVAAVSLVAVFTYPMNVPTDTGLARDRTEATTTARPYVGDVQLARLLAGQQSLLPLSTVLDQRLGRDAPDELTAAERGKATALLHTVDGFSGAQADHVQRATVWLQHLVDQRALAPADVTPLSPEAPHARITQEVLDTLADPSLSQAEVLELGLQTLQRHVGAFVNESKVHAHIHGFGQDLAASAAEKREMPLAGGTGHDRWVRALDPQVVQLRDDMFSLWVFGAAGLVVPPPDGSSAQQTEGRSASYHPQQPPLTSTPSGVATEPVQRTTPGVPAAPPAPARG